MHACQRFVAALEAFALMYGMNSMACLQEAKELLEKFIIGTVKPGTKKPAKQPAVVFDLAAAAAADPSVPLVTLQSPTER
jgi:hypothetical protein